MSDDLRTLAQAVVSAYEILQGERTASVGRDYDVIDDCRTRYHAACKAVDAALALPGASVDHAAARAILAALDAADAQGYARAMGEVVARCQEPAPTRSGSARVRMAHAAGWGNAMYHVAEWAIERCE